MSVKLEPVSVIEMNLGLEPYGEGHTYFASRCKTRMRKYTPNSTGIPDGESILNTPVIDSQCNLFYEEPYAGYQYYGQRKDGTHKVQKYTTPGTGAYWDNLMISAEGKQLEQDMNDWIKKRGRK